MQLAFAKYEGLGNDFIVVDASPQARAALTPQAVIALCDRHRGIGADGVLLVGAEPSMHVTNADGSVPQMCGNGLRCVALHLHRMGRVDTEPFHVATDAGPHRCRVRALAGDAQVEVTMRAPCLLPAEVPVQADAPLVDAPIEVAGRLLRVTAVSMGNPHVVTFDDLGQARQALGPRLAGDPRFPEGANAGFARVVSERVLSLAVYERGAGWTQACGTGACAAAVAAVETGRAPRGAPIEVRLPGGSLHIVVGPGGSPVQMTGPARHVFDGKVALRP